MLKQIQDLNPDYAIHLVSSPKFQTYGEILKLDVQKAIDYVNSHAYDNGYLASVPKLEDLPCIQTLSQHVYGYLKTIAGVVTGTNDVLNGIEYHQCSEVIIAVKDYILAVGHRYDMQGDDYDISKCELFYVPQGTVVECYATTLHYTPIAVSKSGFQTICLLLEGTGDEVARNGILKKKNKWFIAHKDNYDKVQSGDYPGLKGDMIKIKPIA